MELFVFYRKSFNLDVWLGLEYARENTFVKKMLIKLSLLLIEAVFIPQIFLYIFHFYDLYLAIT